MYILRARFYDVAGQSVNQEKYSFGMPKPILSAPQM